MTEEQALLRQERDEAVIRHHRLVGVTTALEYRLRRTHLALIAQNKASGLQPDLLAIFNEMGGDEHDQIECACELTRSDAPANSQSAPTNSHIWELTPADVAMEQALRDGASGLLAGMPAVPSLVELQRWREVQAAKDAVVVAAKERAQVVRDMNVYGSGMDGWAERDRYTDAAVTATVAALAALESTPDAADFAAHAEESREMAELAFPAQAEAVLAGDGLYPSSPHTDLDYCGACGSHRPAMGVLVHTPNCPRSAVASSAAVGSKLGDGEIAESSVNDDRYPTALADRRCPVSRIPRQPGNRTTGR